MEQRTFQHDVVDSTNERALSTIAAGIARHGDVHVARAQTRGRGRLGRAWESAPGEGLYLTLVLLPPPPPLSPVALTMATGLGVLEAVRSLGCPEAMLDWPNDVVARGAKLGGILVESRGLDPGAPHYAVGIGLNVAQRSFPAALERERAVTSLALLDGETDPAAVHAQVLSSLWRALDRVRDDSEGLARQFQREIGCEGARVRVETGRRVLSGRILAFSVDGGLDLLLEDGDRAHLALEHVTALEPL